MPAAADKEKAHDHRSRHANGLGRVTGLQQLMTMSLEIPPPARATVYRPSTLSIGISTRQNNTTMAAANGANQADPPTSTPCYGSLLI
jgi:hypothetical protein